MYFNEFKLKVLKVSLVRCTSNATACLPMKLTVSVSIYFFKFVDYDRSLAVLTKPNVCL